jgi:hypothetical protein
MSTNISVVSIGKKKCKPFVLDVMVFAPEAGFKFEVSVEKSCTPTADALWKLVFDLYKKNAAGQFDQIIHVSYRAETPVEAQVIERTAAEGVTAEQADLLVNKVHPAVKSLEDAASLPPAELEKRKARVKKEMKKVATVDVNL